MSDESNLTLRDLPEFPIEGNLIADTKSMKELVEARAKIDQAMQAKRDAEIARIKASMEENGISVHDISPKATVDYSVRYTEPKRVEVLGGNKSVSAGQKNDTAWSVETIAVPKKSRKAVEEKLPKKVSALPVKYRGENGEAWTGRGLKPRWLVVAMKKAKVKVPDMFAV